MSFARAVAGMVFLPLRLLIFAASRMAAWGGRAPAPSINGPGLFDVLLPLREPVSLNHRDIAFWLQPALGPGMRSEVVTPSLPGTTTSRFSNEEFAFECTVSAEALPLEVANALAAAATPDFSEREQTLLRANEGFIRILCRSGQPSRMIPLASTILSRALEFPEILGLMNTSALSYHPAPWLRLQLAPTADLDARALQWFHVFTSLHAVQGREQYWLHTHGLEQFGQPDLQVRYTERERAGYFADLLANAAIYMIRSGRTLRPGDTAELAGDGVCYEVQSVSPDPEHPFGRLGAVEIVPAPTSALVPAAPVV